MSAADYRHSRVDQGYVFGRLLALLYVLDDRVTGEGGSRAWDKIYEIAGQMPPRGLKRMALYWSDLARTAQRRHLDISDLEDEWVAAMGIVTETPLPERLTARDNDELNAWSAAMVYGYHSERVEIAGTRVAAAREVQQRWMERAQAAVVEAVAAGLSEVDAARKVGLSRPTVRKMLGK